MQPTTKLIRCWRIGLLWLMTLVTALAYVTRKDSSDIYVVVWPPGVVNMLFKMPAPSGPLIDGSTTYTPPLLAAMQSWNSQIGVVQLAGQTVAGETYTSGNGINEIAMDAKADGEDFSAKTVAVTLSYRSGNVLTEGDIVFNKAYTWDSYRGNISGSRLDLQRVAIHEMGHVLGLLHPNEATPPQAVVAIMNSTITSGVETPRTDDINGGRSLYGSSGEKPANDDFASAAALTVNGTSGQVIGATIGGTVQVGEPNHDTETPSHSIWWRWTASSNATATITTFGSNFDSVMGVYTGSAISGLTKVASNDDEERGVIRTSKLSFTPTAGTTYAIAIDGWDGSFGQVTLTLTVGVATGTVPTITTGPSSQSVTLSGAVTFAVTASGDPSGYQWFFNGSAITGATSSTYTLSNVTANNAGSYSVSATNASGSVTSSAVTLTVVTASLSNQVVTTGHDVSLVARSLSGTYQWQLSTNAGSTWADLSNNPTYNGVTTATLNISGAGSALNNNRYRYVVTNSGGSSTSAGISLIVAAALIPFPVGIAVDASGNLYVTDSSAHVIQKINTANQVSTLAGSSGNAGSIDGTGSAARFNQPSGISSAPNATLTVSDTANATIRRISSTGVVTQITGSATIRGNNDGAGLSATFSMPVGLQQNSLGTFYIADATNHTIRALNSSNVVSTFAGSGVAGSTDGTGNAAQFNLPLGIAVDAAGNVFVSDTTNNLIRKITPAGAVTTLAGVVAVSGWQDGTGSAALFNQPEGLATDSAGNLYVADKGNSAIRKISPAGAVTTLAGLSTIGGLKDGTGSDAWFNQPRAITVDSAGNVYVADTGNAAIRKITPAGVVTTMALTAAPVSTGGGSTGGGTTTTTPSTSSGGGGGGAPSLWFLGGVSLLALLRGRFRRPVWR